MFRTALLATVFALPVAAVPALAADQAQGGGQNGEMSYGEKARANQPEKVEDVKNINTGAREAARANDPGIAAGDPSFALPVSALMERTLYNGANEEVGTIENLIVGPEHRIVAAVVDIGAKQIAVPFQDLKVRTGRGPEELLVVTGLSDADLGGMEPFEFGGGMAAVTAPRSDAAQLAGELGIGEADEERDLQMAEDGVDIFEETGALERTAMQLEGQPGEIDAFIATVGGVMDDWYQRMADPWQEADVADDVRERVNDQWADVVAAWGSMRRASQETWTQAHEAFRNQLQEFRSAYQDATAG